MADKVKFIASPEKVLKVFSIAYAESNDEWLKVQCPAHADHEDPNVAHGGINRDSGAFNCVHCHATLDLYGFVAARIGSKRHEVVQHLEKVLGTKDILVNDAYVAACKRLLFTNAEMQAKLRGKGIAFESIDQFSLGLNEDCSRITIPVYHEQGHLINIRSYTFEKTESNKKILNAKGCGKNTLFNIKALLDAHNDTIYITEGELKAILLTQMGFPAISCTAGARNWDFGWTPMFAGKDVVIVYDVDEEGRDGAGKIARSLGSVARSVRDVFLLECANLTKYKGGDITNYFVDEGKSADDFRQLCIATPAFIDPKSPVNANEEDDDHIDAIPTSLARAARHDVAGKKIETSCVVSAKDQTPYIIPKQCVVVCNADRDYCDLCHVSRNRYHKFEIKDSSRMLYELIGMSDKQQQELLKKIGGVYPGCKASTIKTEEYVNIETIRAIPQIAIGSNTDENVVREVFVLGLGIKTNQPYKIQARVIPGKDTHATLLAYHNEPAINDIDSFTLSEDLSLFQPSEWTLAGLTAKLSDIYEDLSSNVTFIYHREDLHLFFDLVWHSALHINFQGIERKGWVDALCIGDSGQGKTEVSHHLMKHYRCGERLDAKGASVAGLVGGLQENNGRWFVTWGIIPINDRRLVLIEEVKGMGTEELCKLTDMRSFGIAALKKIVGETTHARTRLAWISNPRGQLKLGAYNYGVEAVRELIGSLEDIRRFDCVIGVASGEVSEAVLNMHSNSRPVCDHIYTSALCSHLINWIWSRTNEQVTVTADAESEILDCARRISAAYSDSIPIVSPADQRLKIVRLSTALAGRTFSTEDGINIVVRPCHVQAVEGFLNRIYSSSALGYAEYSKAQFQEATLARPDDVSERIRKLPNSRDAVGALLDAASFTWQDIANYTDLDQDQSKEFIAFLAKSQAVKRNTANGQYRKTAAFITLLKGLQSLTNVSRLEQINKGEI